MEPPNRLLLCYKIRIRDLDLAEYVGVGLRVVECVGRGDGVGSVISVGAHVPSFVSRKGSEHRRVR